MSDAELIERVVDPEIRGAVERLVGERDEALRTVLRIGLALRWWIDREHQGWTPTVISDIYRMIDELPFVKGCS